MADMEDDLEALLEEEFAEPPAAKPPPVRKRPRQDAPSARPREAPSSDVCPPHPGYIGGICIRCGALRPVDEPAGEAIALSYIHSGLEIAGHEAERVRGEAAAHALASRRLLLVLDLDHTLLNSVRFCDLSQAEGETLEATDAAARKERERQAKEKRGEGGEERNVGGDDEEDNEAIFSPGDGPETRPELSAQERERERQRAVAALSGRGTGAEGESGGGGGRDETKGGRGGGGRDETKGGRGGGGSSGCVSADPTKQSKEKRRVRWAEDVRGSKRGHGEIESRSGEGPKEEEEAGAKRAGGGVDATAEAAAKAAAPSAASVAPSPPLASSTSSTLDGRLVPLPPLQMWTKLRPGCLAFLKAASALFELTVYTMGDRGYADAMAAILDPSGELFQGRVISAGDSTRRAEKDLDVVLGDERTVLIVDDTKAVWPRAEDNLIQVPRYTFFPVDADKFGVPGGAKGSWLARGKDEPAGGGVLDTVLQVLTQVHKAFFDRTDERKKKEKERRRSGAEARGARRTRGGEGGAEAEDGKGRASGAAGNGATPPKVGGEGASDDAAAGNRAGESRRGTNAPAGGARVAANLAAAPGNAPGTAVFPSHRGLHADLSARGRGGAECSETPGAAPPPLPSLSPGNGLASSAAPLAGGPLLGPLVGASPSGPRADGLASAAPTAAAAVSTASLAAPLAPPQEKRPVDPRGPRRDRRPSSEPGATSALPGPASASYASDAASSAPPTAASGPPDVREELSRIKRRVLRGVVVLFSAVVPLGTDPEANSLWKLAKDLGAECTLSPSPRVTHVVAPAVTEKARWGRDTGRHVVTPAWLVDSGLYWRRVAERAYALPTAPPPPPQRKPA